MYSVKWFDKKIVVFWLFWCECSVFLKWRVCVFVCVRVCGWQWNWEWIFYVCVVINGDSSLFLSSNSMYSKLLAHKKEHIRNFAAESFSFLMRKVQTANHTWAFSAISENVHKLLLLSLMMCSYSSAIRLMLWSLDKENTHLKSAVSYLGYKSLLNTCRSKSVLIFWFHGHFRVSFLFCRW